MIENEMLDELADFLGLREKIAGITARAMNGEIDFAAALKERVALLKDLPVAHARRGGQAHRYMPGGATLVATMKKHGATCALVSGGFTYFTGDGAREAGLRSRRRQHAEASTAGAGRHRRAADPGQGSQARDARRLCDERGLALDDAITVGDGANDLPMLQAAGLGVAFHAKPMVAAQVSARIDHGDLTALLYLQGYRRSDFVERYDP